jgi:hypothetical protein
MSRENYREAQCCYNCKYGSEERDRCGDYTTYCELDGINVVVNTGVCDSFGVETI